MTALFYFSFKMPKVSVQQFCCYIYVILHTFECFIYDIFLFFSLINAILCLVVVQHIESTSTTCKLQIKKMLHSCCWGMLLSHVPLWYLSLFSANKFIMALQTNSNIDCLLERQFVSILYMDMVDVVCSKIRVFIMYIKVDFRYMLQKCMLVDMSGALNTCLCLMSR